MGYHDKPVVDFLRHASQLVSLAVELKCAAVKLQESPLAFAPLPGDDIRRRIQRLEEIQNHRTSRSQFFDMSLFADPAWDMLLLLMQRDLEQLRVSTTELTLASNVPATTALRWVARLTRGKMILRTKDAFDSRRVYVELTDEGRTKINAYLDAVSGQPLVSERSR